MKRGKITFLAVSILLLSSILAAGLLGQAAGSDNLYRNLSLFTEVVSLVERNYVDQVERDALIEGAFEGITDAVDEFSYYVAPEEVPFHHAVDPGEIAGTGLVVSKRLGYAYVIAVVKGSPADDAGIESGDFIERIDGELTTEMPIWKIQSALRWEEGDKLELLVVRSGLDERETFELEKADFEIPAIDVQYLEDYALIEIANFSEGTAETFRAALLEVAEKGVEDVIIDLRGNAGGSYLEAIEAVDHLLAEGTITSLEGRRVDRRVWEADPEVSFEGNVVVLIDNSTAAGAEIFAAALNRHENSQTVGIPTYGRAIEQRFVLLPSGGGLNITVAHYASPEGEPITDNGVRPDVSVNRAALALNEQNGTSEDLILKRGVSALE
ncbi:MAG: S41 family peptidase [Thermoanaerobaculia bacterium]|nr:S41 family peptidase [Thermoanaerobaculia bacterium]